MKHIKIFENEQKIRLRITATFNSAEDAQSFLETYGEKSYRDKLNNTVSVLVNIEDVKQIVEDFNNVYVVDEFKVQLKK